MTGAVASVDPATGDLLATFDTTSSGDIAAMVGKARAAQEHWAQAGPGSRADLVRRVGEIVGIQTDEIVALIQQETGKLSHDATGEVLDVIDGIDYYLARAARDTPGSISLPHEVFPATQADWSGRPYGVVGLVMPWNFPFYTPMLCLIPALLTGNAVLLKPSEHATLVGHLMARILAEAGLPDGLLTVVPGADETGRDVVAVSDKVFFVGSVAAGRDVVQNAGLTPVSLELGGNSAAVVLPDADLDLAAAGIVWGATYHAGQDCAGIKRVVVDRSVAGALIDRMRERLSALRPGVDYGPYISREAMDLVRSRTADAIAAGAELLYDGGTDGVPHADGNWLAPALVRVDRLQVDLVAEETFGNVVPVITVDGVDDAVDVVNESRNSLSAAVFGRDVERARELAERLHVGMVFINDPIVNLPAADHWTGWNDSGNGGGMESRYEQCTRKRVTTVNTRGSHRDFWYRAK